MGDGELRELEHAWAGRLRLMRNERFELVEPFLALRHVLMGVRLPLTAPTTLDTTTHTHTYTLQLYKITLCAHQTQPQGAHHTSRVPLCMHTHNCPHVRPQELSEGGPWKTQQLLALASVARKAKRPQIAAQAIYQLSRAAPAHSLATNDSEAQRWRLAEAKLLWEQKETVQAVAIARSVVQSLSAEGASPVLCSALLCAGRWLAESRSASSSVVRKEYLERAVKVRDISYANAY